MNTKDREAERAAIVAEGLTEAQRKVLRRMTDEDRYYTCRELRTSGATMNHLWAGIQEGYRAPFQLVHRDYTDYPRLAWTFCLTPLGLAIRDHLRGEQ